MYNGTDDAWTKGILYLNNSTVSYGVYNASGGNWIYGDANYDASSNTWTYYFVELDDDTLVYTVFNADDFVGRFGDVTYSNSTDICYANISYNIPEEDWYYDTINVDGQEIRYGHFNETYFTQYFGDVHYDDENITWVYVRQSIDPETGDPVELYTYYNITTGYWVIDSSVYAPERKTVTQRISLTIDNDTANNRTNIALFIKDFDKSDTGSINRNYGSTFYFYKKNTENQNSSGRTLKNRSLSLNSFVTLRNILNDTTHNIKNINIKLKKYMSKKNMDFTGPNTTKNKNKTSRFFYQKETKDSKLKELLESFQKKEDKTLKLVKKDEGINSQNIWIKRTTANLLSFGNSFMNLNDNQFYLERKRIMEDYPKIEKEANICGDEFIVKDEENNLIKQQKIKMEQNSRKMNDLNNVNNLIFNKLKEKIKEIKEKK